MNSRGKKVAQNAGYLMVSQLITWGLSSILMVVLPRYLGPEVIGEYYTAVAVWSIMGMFISFGMNTLLVKEIAKNPADISELYGNSFILRIVFFLVSVLAVVIYAYIAKFTSKIVIMLVLIGISTLFWQISFVSQSFLRGLERMEYISAADILSKLFNTVITLILVYLEKDILSIVSVSIGMGLLSFMISNHYVKTLQKPEFRVNLSRALWMLKQGFQYFLTDAAITIYIEMDIIIVSLLANERTVGWFGAADRVYGTLMFVPSVLMSAVFPALSRENVKDKEVLKRFVQKSFNLIFLVGIPIGFGLFIVANSLSVLLFGKEFVGSGPVLMIRGLVLVFNYLNIVIGASLISMDRQNPWTAVIAFATVLCVPLDLIFIAWTHNIFSNGAIGAAIVLMITEIFMFIGGIKLLPTNTLNKSSFIYSIKTVSAGLIMIAVTWWFRELFIAIPIVIGALSYSVSILVLGLIEQDDWELIQGLWKSIVSKLNRRQVKPI